MARGHAKASARAQAQYTAKQGSQKCFSIIRRSTSSYTKVGCSICEATTPSYKPWNGSPNENRLDYFLHSLELHLPISRSFQLESNLDRLSSKLERAIQHKVELKSEIENLCQPDKDHDDGLVQQIHRL
ncbi:hypothetical protein MJO29_006507 [Puccinia striiformis f. sp. tritici]|nr:hypothetical protein MJO29_006507 [Puccinia striiformis f. sp. tritici]